ncbi:MAG: ATP synthase F0 subunit B [Alphaproteobacteria bacterium]|nr:MAG: ATP synthase F0 subunit B [Alphaproteobacteria bacterium]
MELFVLDYLHSQYFWTTLAFLILLGVMYKFVVPSVLAVLDARAAQIAADLDAAERGRLQAEGTLAEYAAQLAQAKKDAGEIVSRARAESEALANERIKQVEADLARKAEDARKSIEAARDEAMRNVQKDIAEIALQVASKLLDQSVDAKVASNLTDKALAKGLN